MKGVKSVGNVSSRWIVRSEGRRCDISSDNISTRVVAYLRVSTDGQVDGYGLDAQEAAVRGFCEDIGLTISAVFREEGVSGKRELNERLQLLALNDYAEEHGITIVVIPALDRLARDLMLQESILREWEKRGWNVLSVKEPGLTGDDATRRFVRQVFGAVSELEHAMTVARTRSGRIARARSGQPSSGAVPLGYAVGYHDGKKIRRIDAPGAAVVRKIFDLRADGLSLQAIADVLNAEGVKPPGRSKQWWKTTVGAILRNQAYHGIVSFREDGETLFETHNEELRLV